MMKDCTTGVAAGKVALPPCDAEIEHVPAATKVVVPEDVTVQTPVVVDAYETARPDEAMPVSGGGEALNAVFGGCGNVIALVTTVTGVTANVRVTGFAVVHALLPAWLAVIEQVPAATKAIVPDVTVHTPSEFEA